MASKTSTQRQYNSKTRTVNAGGLFFRLPVYDDEVWEEDEDQEAVRVPAQVPSYFSTKFHCPPRLRVYSGGGHNWTKAQSMLNQAILPTCKCNPTPCRVENGEAFEIDYLFRIENTALFERHTDYVNDAKSRLVEDLTTQQLLHDIYDGLPEWIQRLTNKNILKDGSVTDAGTIYALHGTSVLNLHSIMQNGLQTKYARPSNNLYGRGIYFADKSCKSSQYAHDENGMILICRVFLGRVEVLPHVCQDKKAPAAGHDSAMAKKDFTDPQNGYKQLHNEFIVYDDDAVYPEFAILYRKKLPEDPPSQG